MKALWSALWAAAIAGCASTPPAAISEPQRPVPAEPAMNAPLAAHEAGTFEQRQRDRAAHLERQGRWADAALVWEVLTVLRPESVDYAQRLAQTRRAIEAGAAVRLQRAHQALARGDVEGAQRLYLSVLALEPTNTQACEGLRHIDRDRNKRLYLGRPSRLTLR